MEMLESKGQSLKAVIHLEVDPEALVDRLNNRIAEMKAAGQEIRSDDTPETLRERINVFREQTAPIIPYFEEKGMLSSIDGMGSIEQVESDIAAVLD